MTDEAAAPRTAPHPARTMIRSGLVLVAVSPLTFAASLWTDSWGLYALFGIALNFGFVLILRAWSSTPRGDGAWPFYAPDGPPPRTYAPEFFYRLKFFLWMHVITLAVAVGLVIALAVRGFIDPLGDTSFLSWAGGFLARIAPFALPVAILNAHRLIRWSPHFALAQWWVPYRIRQRRDRFNAAWPNVDGWG